MIMVWHYYFSLYRKKEDKERKEKIVFDLLNNEKKRKNKETIENQREVQQAQCKVRLQQMSLFEIFLFGRYGTVC